MQNRPELVVAESDRLHSGSVVKQCGRAHGHYVLTHYAPQLDALVIAAIRKRGS